MHDRRYLFRTVTGKNAWCDVVGLVAKAYNSTIDNCRSYGSFRSEVISTGGSSTAEASGIVGIVDNGTKVINCISYGKIESYGSGDADQLVAYAGGIASYANNSSKILNCGSRVSRLPRKWKTNRRVVHLMHIQQG